MVASKIQGDTPHPARLPQVSPILVIDDDFAIRRTIAEVLIDEGYQVWCAANGREALSLLEERGPRPGLIVLDIWMPRMDGLEFRVLQKGLATVSDIPVVVITASRLLPRELPELGLTHVLRKPLHLDQLLATIHQLIVH